MIAIKSIEQFTAAAAKAKKVRPLVRFCGKLGEYKVAGSTPGTFYAVTFARENGQKVARCECQGNKERGRMCYHIAAAIGNHLMKAKEAAQAAPTGDDLAQHVAECDDPDCTHAPSLTERIARDRANIAAMRTRLNLPSPVIRTFASRDEALAVAASANADLF